MAAQACTALSGSSQIQRTGALQFRSLPCLARTPRRSCLKAQAQQQEGQDTQPAKPQKPKDNMSPEMKKRLKEEYIGFGGSPDKPLPTNYFLVISGLILVLALLTKLTGAI
ncbi:hypothetical protein WJX74_010800 [Apatococcus lobatus]|uniref:Uncharacterized protein n=1 Tax=Apatococcus lobatus TaxID=904363 RepID=A0AAW1RG75_9CHLO